MCPNKADLNRADPGAGLEGKGRGEREEEGKGRGGREVEGVREGEGREGRQGVP